MDAIGVLILKFQNIEPHAIILDCYLQLISVMAKLNPDVFSTCMPSDVSQCFLNYAETTDSDLVGHSIQVTSHYRFDSRFLLVLLSKPIQC